LEQDVAISSPAATASTDNNFFFMFIEN